MTLSKEPGGVRDESCDASRDTPAKYSASLKSLGRSRGYPMIQEKSSAGFVKVTLGSAKIRKRIELR